MSLFKRTGALLVALFLTFTLMAPQSARADATTDASISKASTWIADTWKNKKKLFFAAGTTADGVIALSAANQEPNTVRDMLVDLKDRGPAYTDFDGGYPAGLAKVIMAADMAGQNPRTFFGCERDLVDDLKAMVVQRPSQSREYWGPYLIAIALSRAGEQVPDWVIEDMAKNQAGGGFGYYENDGTFVGDPDYTAVGVSAMDQVSKNPKNAKDHAKALASIKNATTWSLDAANQKSDATSNSYYWATYSSSNSTGMLASALSEVGVEVESPVRYLMSQQNGDGGWAAAHKDPGKERKSDVMATTQAILGVAGAGYSTIRSTQVPEMAKCATPTPPVKPTPVKTVYNTPGYHNVNGREWFTTCEKYSATTRCKTTIKATKVAQVGGRFVATNDYVFNNLTYLPAPKSLWKGNPLGNEGEWTTAGRQWKTECNTPVTGNGCRSYIWAKVIANVAKPGQPVRYAWIEQWEFNNMVQYSA
ncbi:MAG: hypothetical protein Q4P15_08335 [Propionibacteriaceae bacterium]|nr:hypothetical protein [Propionibacteriaceae bacterium]